MQKQLPIKRCQTCQEIILQKYYHTPSNWIKVKFCRLKCFRHTKTTREKIKRGANSGRFNKGDKPPHTGKTKKEYPKLSNSGTKKGNIPWNYNGGWIENGYRVLSLGGNKHIFEHRYVIEQFLGRRLQMSEIVHHLNGNKLDNRLENLEIMTRLTHPAKHNRWHKIK